MIDERNRDQVLGTEIRKLVCKLTREELDAKRGEMGEYPERINDAEGELARFKAYAKTEASRLDGQIAILRAEQAQMIVVVSRGEERRDVKVERIGDYQTGVVRFERVDTREVVESRPMQDNERQKELALQPDDDDEQMDLAQQDPTDRDATDDDSVDEVPDNVVPIVKDSEPDTLWQRVDSAPNITEGKKLIEACEDVQELRDFITDERASQSKPNRGKIAKAEMRIKALLEPSQGPTADDLSGEQVQGADLGGMTENLPVEMESDPGNTDQDGGLFGDGG